MVRRMNSTLGMRKIKIAIKQRGVEPDLIDIYSYYDKSLSYSENLEQFMKLTTKLKRKQEQRSGFRFVDRLENAEQRRSKHSILMDNMKQSNKQFDIESLTTKQYNQWKKNKDQYDVTGIDSKPSHSGSYTSPSFNLIKPRSKSISTQKQNSLISTINKYDSGQHGADVGDVIDAYKGRVPPSDIKRRLKILINQGDVYIPRSGYVKVL